MSHLTNVKLRVRDLDCVEEAARKRGGVLMRDQKTHAWYGHMVGDSAEGRAMARERGVANLGKCEHAIRLADHRHGDYEVGVVAAKDGDGYDLVMDTWGPGQRLVQRFGSDLDGLRQEYAVAVTLKKTKATLAKKGFTAVREDLLNGRVRLRLRRR